MAAKTIKTVTVASVAAVFIAGELLAYVIAGRSSVDPILLVGIIRLVQIPTTVLILVRFEGGLGAIGWAPAAWPAGVWQGALWSAGFGLLAGLGMAGVYWRGGNPLSFFRADLSTYNLPLFFVVGGLVAPVFEELCFRGATYTFMRQIGAWIISRIPGRSGNGGDSSALATAVTVLIAIVGSTAIFALLHSVRGLPITQMIGGVVFALAYETSGNLMVPMIIHITANLAIFSLSLI